IYNASPPERRTKLQNNPTLLFSWWATVVSVVIIGFRVFGRYSRNNRLFREDKIMAWSIIPLLARMAFVHVVLIYGTNNIKSEGLTDPLAIHHRIVGSRMVLAARIFYALFIWTAKFTVTEFLKRITDRFWKRGYELGLRSIQVFLIATFVAVVIATLGECQPFVHYWQVIPDPGPQCRQGYAHLLTMGVTDIITDVLIVIFPVPIILQSGMPIKRKVSLVLLFSMSIILIAITAVRVPYVVRRNGLQQFRTVFASAEILAATAVSNVIVLGSFLRDRGVKKQKYRGGSTSDSMDRRSSTRRPTIQQWGSDEDLVRDVGYRVDPELAGEQQKLVRPAPVANLEILSRHGTSNFPTTSWQFPSKQDSSGESASKAKEFEDPQPSPGEMRGSPTTRRVSFFDVGGLLGPQLSNATPSPTDSVIIHDFAQPRRGSSARAFISDVGGLLPPPRGKPSTNQRRASLFPQSLAHHPSQDIEMTARPSQRLQDPGGLLSESSE
ncbi:hypothetical protein GQ43DRAFT_339952, partial [Delitschia confertaspora ATCC 74209]